MDSVFFASAAELRAWFETNHDSATELWVGFYKKAPGKMGVSYSESVDEALCYGWIDGVRHRIDGERYTNRFTPRRKGSYWSAVNIRRVGELTEQGRMQPSGLAAFALRDETKTQQYSFEAQSREFAAEYEARFQASAAAWEFFQAQAPYYQRRGITWVMSAKREATRLQRLEALIDESAQGRRMAYLLGPGTKRAESTPS